MDRVIVHLASCACPLSACRLPCPAPTSPAARRSLVHGPRSTVRCYLQGRARPGDPGDRRPSLHRHPFLSLSPQHHPSHPEPRRQPPAPATAQLQPLCTTPAPPHAPKHPHHTLHTLHPACGTAAMSGPTTQNVANVAPPTDPGPGNLVGDADAARRAANVVVGKSSRARPNKGQLGWGNLSPDILQCVPNPSPRPHRRRKLTVQPHPRARDECAKPA